jgi:predicted dehydrogenase
MKMKNTRRSFVKKLAGSVAAASAAPGILLAKNSHKATIEIHVPQRASGTGKKVRIAGIGMGIMGMINIETALKVPGVELVAACDLYDGRLTRVKEVFGENIATTKDYKDILKRKDVDAVFISTTDHWHDHISIEAMESGKAVFCEKPMVHKLEEGHAVIKTQNRTGMKFQVGSQRVSSIVYAKAHELYKAGYIGKLVVADARFDRQSALGAWQYSIPPGVSEKEVDWKAYLGDAPKSKFDPLHFFRWRNYKAYGTGVAGDLFVHLFSGLHVVTGSLGPEKIYATGGLRYWDDGRDVPDVMIGAYDYPKSDTHDAFNVQVKVNFIDGSGGGSHLKLIGTEGMLTITDNSVILNRSKMAKNPGYGGWDSFFTFDMATQKRYEEWYKATYPEPKQEIQVPQELEFKAPKGYDDRLDHIGNFFDAITNDKPIVEDAEFGLRAAGAALCANISYFEERPVRWDPVEMKLLE